jgi:hypothetical protein
MEWLVIGAVMAWFISKHHDPTLGATAAGNLGAPTGPAVPIGPATSIGGGGGPGANPGIMPPTPLGSDVVGANTNQYGAGFGNTVGQTTLYPAGRIQFWLPVRNPGAAVAGSGLPSAGGSEADLGGDAPPQGDQTSGPQPTQGYVIGRGY